MRRKIVHKPAFSLALFAAVTNAFTPLPIPYNTHGSHGPDGPWNYITVNVGTGPMSTVDFYPMLEDQMNMLVTHDACTKDRPCLDPAPHYYNDNADRAKNSTFDQTTHAIDSTWHSRSPLNLNGNGIWSVTQIHNPLELNTTQSFATNNVTQAVGSIHYTPVSLLSLEPSVTANKTTLKSGGNATQNTLLQSWHKNYENAPQTFALHIGSARFNQSGSLYLSGWDPTRLIEKPAVFDSHGAINLKSISIATNTSEPDPWASAVSKPPTNLLSALASSPSAPVPVLPVFLSPHTPTLLLPTPLCQSLSQLLPISYNATLNLYLWNTSSTLYKTLTSSPAFHLAFTFTDPASTTIKLPFALLDLTLTAPLTDAPTQYFPCEARASAPWRLGRAFLQAAVFMQTYSPDAIVLGQAPGPAGVGFDAAPLVFSQAGGVGPLAAAPRFEDTWKGVLRPGGGRGGGSGSSSSAAPSSSSSSSSAAVAASSSSVTPLPAPQKLTPGGIAGVVLGCMGGVAFVAGVIWLDLRRQRKAEGGEAGGGRNSVDKTVGRGGMEGAPGRTGGGGGSGGAALKQYNMHAGVNEGYRPARPLRPPTQLALGEV